jgi:hypothetical protein
MKAFALIVAWSVVGLLACQVEEDAAEVSCEDLNIYCHSAFDCNHKLLVAADSGCSEDMVNVYRLYEENTDDYQYSHDAPPVDEEEVEECVPYEVPSGMPNGVGAYVLGELVVELVSTTFLGGNTVELAYDLYSTTDCTDLQVKRLSFHINNNDGITWADEEVVHLGVNRIDEEWYSGTTYSTSVNPNGNQMFFDWSRLYFQRNPRVNITVIGGETVRVKFQWNMENLPEDSTVSLGIGEFHYQDLETGAEVWRTIHFTNDVEINN